MQHCSSNFINLLIKKNTTKNFTFESCIVEQQGKALTFFIDISYQLTQVRKIRLL